MKLFGLKNCDTCRKAVKELGAAGRAFDFFDVRSDGVNHEDIFRWVDAVGQDLLINRRGTTWRGLPEERKSISDRKEAIALMLDNPALIKRPVIEMDDGRVFVGWGRDTKDALGL